MDHWNVESVIGQTVDLSTGGAERTIGYIGTCTIWRAGNSTIRKGDDRTLVTDGVFTPEGWFLASPILKRNFEVFSACDWLAALTAHVPNAGEHPVRYYGRYSNVGRGKRRKATGKTVLVAVKGCVRSRHDHEHDHGSVQPRVDEVDPLGCSRCAGPMCIIAFIEQPEVIEKILAHLGLWPVSAHSPPSPLPSARATGRAA